MSNNPNLNPALLKFCLEHSDYNPSGPVESLPPRDPKDYEFLRAALNNLKTDAERMKEFLLTLVDPKADFDSRENALQEISFLVEDIDNANDFCKIDGFPVMKSILESKKDEDEDAIAEKKIVLTILADIAQNNPRGQQYLFNNGIVAILLSFVDAETHPSLIFKAQGAISALIRSDDPRAKISLATGGYFTKCKQILLKTSQSYHQAITRTIINLRHLCDAGEIYQDELRQQEILDSLVGFVGCDNGDIAEEVRIQSLICLIAATNGNVDNVAYVASHGLFQTIAKNVARLETSGDELTQQELDLSKELLKMTTTSKSSGIKLLL